MSYDKTKFNSVLLIQSYKYISKLYLRNNYIFYLSKTIIMNYIISINIKKIYINYSNIQSIFNY